MAGRISESIVEQIADRSDVLRLIVKENVEVVSLAQHGQISDRIWEQIVHITVPQVSQQPCARCCVVLVLLILNEHVEAVNLALHGQFFERICEQIVHASVSQVTEQFVVRLTQASGPQTLTEQSVARFVHVPVHLDFERER